MENPGSGKNGDAASKFPGWPAIGMAAVLSILLLAICGRFVDWNKVFVNGMDMTLNDQVGYISVGRVFADHGKLESTLIMPVELYEATTKNFLYVPGHYIVLGLFFKLFGYSAAHSFWPSLVAFVWSSVLVIVIASALFGRERAFSSWAFFAFFPFNLIYSFTAMAEMTVVASALSALALFLWLPTKWKVWLGPLALALPVLFRETGVVVAVVMAGILYKESGRRLGPIAIFSILCVLAVVLTLMSPAASGRPTHLGTPSATVVWTNFKSNWELLVHPFSKPGADALQVFGMYFMISGIPVSLGLWFRKRDPVYLSMFLMLAVMASAILGLYQLWWLRGVRVMLVTQPFAAILWADLVQTRWRFLPVPRFLAWASAAIMMTVGIWGVYSVFKTEGPINAVSDRDIAFLESLGHDTRGTLASPWEISLDFYLKHYPGRWTFVPGDDQELRLLNAKYPMTTLVLRTGVDGAKLSPGAIAAAGLVREDAASYNGQAFRVFRRAGPPALRPN